MALTSAELKKLSRIEKEMADKEKEKKDLMSKAAEQFANLAIKNKLWRLDKETIVEELRAIAKKHGLAKNN